MKKLVDNLYISAQITAQDIKNLAEQGIAVIINNRPDNEESGQISHSEAQQIAEQYGIEYHYLPMENGKPIPADTVLQFNALIHASEGKICAHCRSGMRSTVLWAMGELQNKTLDVPTAVRMAQSIGIQLEKAQPLLESIE